MSQQTAQIEDEQIRHMSARRRDIQGLRAVAVLLVVANHFVDWPGGGFIGVDVFFVISGFLITGLLLREHDTTGTISLGAFYRRRFRRLLPIAAFVVVVTAGASWLLFTADRARGITVDGLWALLFSSNWRFAATGTDYLQATGPLSPLQHYWSLSVEEQFYFVWPLLLIAALGFSARRPRRQAAIAITIIGTASFVWAMFETSVFPTWAYFSTFSRVWELAAGALLAIAASKVGEMPEAARPYLAWAGLLAIVGGSVLITVQTPFPGPFAIVPVLGAVAVIAAGIGGGQRFLWPLTNRASTYVGDISYSLYLWHFPAIIFATVIFAGTPRRALIVAFIATLALSVLSYHFIENPIRRSSWLDPRSPHFRRWLIAGVTALVLTVAGVFVVPATAPGQSGSAIEITDRTTAIAAALEDSDWPEILQPSLDDVGAGTPETIGTEAGCLNPPTTSGDESCAYGSADSGKIALVVGDSIAMAWIPTIEAAIGDEYEVRGIGFRNCPFAEVVIQSEQVPEDSAKCNSVRKTQYESISKIAPDLLIISDSELGFNRLGSKSFGDKAEAEWRDGMSRALGATGQNPAQVVVLSPPPMSPASASCVTRISSPIDCVGPISERWMSKSIADREAATEFGAAYVDTSLWFCAREQCPLYAGGVIMRTDGMHLTEQYAVGLKPEMAAVLPRS